MLRVHAAGVAGARRREQLTWRAARIGQLPLAALLLLLLPLGLTFYLWKVATENDQQRGNAKFEALTIESEKALQNRLASYGNALLGAAGFIQGSDQVVARRNGAPTPTPSACAKTFPA